MNEDNNISNVEHYFDDVFVAIDHFFVTSSLSYALKKKEISENYSFCIITKHNTKSYEINSIEFCGGKHFKHDEIHKDQINCTNINVHSFGDIEWQESIIEKIKYDNLGLYGDFLKNWYEFTNYKSPFRVIQFGYIIDLSIRPQNTFIECVEFSYCFEAYKIQKKFCLEICSPAVSTALKADPLNLIFLRYWGYGPYRFSEGISLKDAVLKSLPSTGHFEWYIKGDPRIPRTDYEETKSHLFQNGQKVSGLNELFDLEIGVLNNLPAEFLLSDCTIIPGKAIVYDSSICFFLKIALGLDIIFPTEDNISEIFATKTAINTINMWASIYKEVCEKIDASEDKNTIHTIKR